MKEGRERIEFLTTSIGRGHRFYLAGLARSVLSLEANIDTSIHLAPAESGFLGKALWWAIHRAYKIGSSGGRVGKKYEKLRQTKRVGSVGSFEKLLAGGLKRFLTGSYAPLVVDHPLLVTLVDYLNVDRQIIYMHGELVAPDDSLTSAPDLTLVPTEDVRIRFISAGAAETAVVVTGSCIESGLTNILKPALEKRLARIEGKGSLTGAFYSSGAEPREHLRKIICGVKSILSSGHRAIVFAQSGGALEKKMKALAGLESVELITYDSIEREEKLPVERFEKLDFFVAPSHERINWAVAGGLPMFMIGPAFGTFAPLNWRLGIQRGVAAPVDSASDSRELGNMLESLRRSGKLSEMARNGFGDLPYDGFKKGAEILLERLRT